MPAPDPTKTAANLAALADQRRVLVRRGGPLRKDGICVVYWMQRAVRSVDNPALDIAIEAANLLALPVVIYFGVIPNYPNANLRHYHFLQQGLRDACLLYTSSPSAWLPSRKIMNGVGLLASY